MRLSQEMDDEIENRLDPANKRKIGNPAVEFMKKEMKVKERSRG